MAAAPDFSPKNPRVKNIVGLAAALVLMLVLASAAEAASAAGGKRFQAGIKAYRAGQYEKALDAFLDARRLGVRDANLHFNLGLSYYRLGRYEEARSIFERLRTDMRYTPVADYHLGLVAAQMGESQNAHYYLAGAKSMSMNAGLRGLADTAMRQEVLRDLPRVDGEMTSVNTDAAYYLLAGSGYDSNPSLVRDSLEVDDPAGSTAYVELSGDARQPLLQRTLGPVSVAGSLRLRDYSAHDPLDETSGEVGLRRDWQGNVWRSSFGALGGLDLIGGEVFQRSTGVEGVWHRALGPSSFRLEHRSERLTGGEGYNYLEGWRHRAGLSWRRPAGPLRLRADYDFTFNDRNDLERDGEFFSHSPVRHSAGFSVGRWLRHDLNLEGRARYRESRYRDADRLMQNGQSVEVRREEELALAGLRTRLLFTGGWNALLDYQYTRNRSTRDEFGYDRHLLLLGLEWLK